MTNRAAISALGLFLCAGVTAIRAQSPRKGQIHFVKECSQYNFMAGSYCSIMTSNLAEITSGAKVYYDQAAGIPANMLDSNVLLVVTTGNWAVGRCTVDGTTGLGLCTFSDGSGSLAGFTAQIKVRIDAQ